MNPLPCPHCEEGKHETSRHGGNDPNTWLVECEECSGTGIALCSDCGEDATHDLGGGILLCPAHHAEWIAAEAAE